MPTHFAQDLFAQDLFVLLRLEPLKALQCCRAFLLGTGLPRTGALVPMKSSGCCLTSDSISAIMKTIIETRDSTSLVGCRSFEDCSMPAIHSAHAGLLYRVRSRLGVGAIALALAACNSTASPEGEVSGASDAPVVGGDKKLQVVTTFLPMTQFTKAVAGNCAEVQQILPTNIGPHDYQAKPSDAQKISQAAVLVKNGLELESFLEPLIKNAGNGDLKIVDASQGLALVAIAEEAPDGEHDHDHDHNHDHDHDHGHDGDHDHDHDGEKANKLSDAGHEGHDHGEFDPHVWLDPVRAAEQVNNIREGLAAAAPDCAAEFTANAAQYQEKLDALHQEIQQTLAPFAGKTFVTYHDFANYFAARYGLEVEFLVGVPEANPSPNDVKRVIETAQASDLKTLLAESTEAAAPFEALAQDLNVRVSTFSPNEVGGPGSTEPEYYFTVMRKNLSSLKAAFVGG